MKHSSCFSVHNNITGGGVSVRQFHWDRGRCLRGAFGARLPSPVSHEPLRRAGHASRESSPPGFVSRRRVVRGGVNGRGCYGLVVHAAGR